MMEKIKNLNLIKIIIIFAIIILLVVCGTKIYSNHLIKFYEKETNSIILSAKDYVQLNQANENIDIFSKLDKHEKVTDGVVYVNNYNEVAVAIIYDDVCYVKLYNGNNFINDIDVDYCKSYLNLHVIQYNKKVEEDKADLNNPSDKFYRENLTKDAYGYVVIDNENGSDLYELRKNDKNAKVASCTGKCGIHGLNTSSNKVVFYIHYYESQTNKKYTDKVVSIDLSAQQFNVVTTSTNDLIHNGGYFAVSDKYLFTPNENYMGIKRVDLKTGETLILNKEVECSEIFVYDNKLFTYNYSRNNTNYYTVDFEGNINKITKQQYIEAVEKSNYSINDFENKYFYYKNNKITINNNKLMYGEKNIYNAKNGAKLRLLYSFANNVVAFQEYIPQYDTDLTLGYYKYNLDDNTLNKILEGINLEENDIYESVILIEF